MAIGMSMPLAPRWMEDQHEEDAEDLQAVRSSAAQQAFGVSREGQGSGTIAWKLSA